MLNGIAKRPTLKDIAKACGVSRATVGRALSGKGYVEKRKRKLIQDQANKLGYRTSTIARALRTRRTFSIGVLIPDITNPIFPQIVKGIDDVASAKKHTTFLCNTDEKPDKQLSLMGSLLDRQVDGLILVSQSTTPKIDKLLHGAPPCIYVNRHPKKKLFDYVGPDNKESIRSLVDHLWNLGHRRIGYIAGPKSSSTSRERLCNFLNLMKARDAKVEKSLIYHGLYDVKTGRAAASFLLSLKNRPTAIISANDFVALGVIEYALELGLTVPDDLSVTGFDDAFGLDQIHNYPLPVKRITTVDQPKYQLGVKAACLLLKRIEHPDCSPNKIIFPTNFKEGDTSGPVPRVIL